MSLKPLFKLPDYVDEILDIVRIGLHTLRAYREESPYFDMLAVLLGIVTFVVMASLFRRYVIKRNNLN